MLGISLGGSEKAEKGLEIVLKINKKCGAGEQSAVELMGPTYCMVEVHAENGYDVGSNRETDKALAKVAELRGEIKGLRKTKGDISSDIAAKERELHEQFKNAVIEADRLLKKHEEKVPAKLNSLVDDVLRD